MKNLDHSDRNEPNPSHSEKLNQYWRKPVLFILSGCERFNVKTVPKCCPHFLTSYIRWQFSSFPTCTPFASIQKDGMTRVIPGLAKEIDHILICYIPQTTNFFLMLPFQPAEP